MAYDPLAALGALQNRGVRFVVIGGIAGRLWGSPTMTNDIDICYGRDRANLRLLADALACIGARLRGVDEEVPFQLDAPTLEAGANFTFLTEFGPLDILGQPAGMRTFDQLDANAVEFDLGDGLVVRVAALEDLMEMKQAAGRPKDRVELEILGALLEERSGTAPDGR